MNKIVDVQPLENYRVWLKFSDGMEGAVDLSGLAGRGGFTAWANRDVFTAVRVEEGGGIEWPGEIDMCPDALYLRLTGKSVEDIFPGLGRLPPTPKNLQFSPDR